NSRGGERAADLEPHVAASRGDRDGEPCSADAGEVPDRDLLPLFQPAVRDAAAHDEVTVGRLGDEGVEQDLVRVCDSPTVWRRSLSIGGMAADPWRVERRLGPALPPRVRPALAVSDHELVAENSLGTG